jgi:thiol-disulfide isomerase/thioredoxin
MSTTKRRLSTPALIIGGWAIAMTLIVGFTALTGDDGSGSTARAAAGPPVPQTEFEYFDGTTATLAAYEGRPLVVNFWASWCPSCVAEMSAAFRPVQQELGDEVAFVGFNIQDGRERALELVDESGVLFDLAEDPSGDLYSELGGIGMPFTLFVNEHGEIVHEHNGPLTRDQLAGQIEDLLLS